MAGRTDIPRALRDNIARVIVGKDGAIDLVLTALLAGGHILIQDVPGLGKTLLARALAKSVDARFQRVQFTPDLLPSDITGVSIFNERDRAFEFRPGPVFANILLGDELNRATPRTQSALLEAMEERQVTVDGVTHPLPAPFFVIATQNPVEQEGVYALPEAQLDRFLMQISIGYPSQADEVRIIRDQLEDNARLRSDFGDLVPGRNSGLWSHHDLRTLDTKCTLKVRSVWSRRLRGGRATRQQGADEQGGKNAERHRRGSRAMTVGAAACPHVGGPARATGVWRAWRLHVAIGRHDPTRHPRDWR